MDESPIKPDCSCYTLQTADTKPIIIIKNDPVVTLGLVAVFLLICAGFASAVYVRRRGPQENEQ